MIFGLIFLIEEWRDIIGYEGVYQISNLGRVQRLAGYGRTKNRLLSICKYKKGRHHYVTLKFRANRRSRKNIHTLVLEAFVGPRPSLLHVCRHLDGNPQNNVPDNLAWGSASENSQDLVRHGNHPWTKLTVLDIPKIRNLFSKRIGDKRIGEMFGVNRKTIADIRHLKTWSHV